MERYKTFVFSSVLVSIMLTCRYADAVHLLHGIDPAQVMGSPVLSEGPLNQTVLENNTVQLWCRILNLTEGSGLLVWKQISSTVTRTLFINSQREHTTPDRYSVQPVDSTGLFGLRIDRTQPSDRAQYECSVFTTQLRATAWVDVHAAPNVPSLLVNATEGLVEGDAIQLSCAASGGWPEPVISWYRGDTLMQQTQVIKSNQPYGEIRSLAVVRLTSQDHRRKYKCHVVNSVNLQNPHIAEIQLNVQFAPKASIKLPDPVMVIENKPAEIECEANANPPTVAFGWRYNGDIIDGVTSSRLRIESVARGDVGEYQCDATNRHGTGTSTTHLTVLYGPVVTATSKLNVTEGSDVILRCHVESLPAPRDVTWVRSDQSDSPVLRQPQPAVFTGDDNYEVRIPSINRQAAGRMKCVAKCRLVPSQGVALETSATEVTEINVLYAPGATTISGPTTALVSTRVTLSCTAGDLGNPTGLLRWSKDGRELGSGAELTIPSVTLSDEGNYSCTAFNSIGSGISASTKLTIYQSPQWQSPALPGTHTLRVGVTSAFSLSCIVTARPTPDVMWLKNGQELTSWPGFYAESLQTDNVAGLTRVIGTLTFQGNARNREVGLVPEDSANYTCRAYSTSGTYAAVQQTTEVIVQYPPRSSSTSSIVATDLQSSTTLHCTAFGVPSPNISWTGPGGALIRDSPTSQILHQRNHNDITSTLTLQISSSAGLGTYTCVAQNIIGSHVAKIQVIRKGPPAAPSALRVQSVSWGSAVVSWTPGFDGGYTQRFQLLITNSSAPATVVDATVGSHRYNISDLQPSKNYSIRVRAVNQAGQSRSSAAINFQTHALRLPVVASLTFKPSANQLRISALSEGQCARIERSQGSAWQVVKRCTTDVDVEVEGDDRTEVRVFVCLTLRPDVCGSPVSATLITDDLSDTLVIAVSVVCAAVVLVLVAVLTYVCCRMRKKSKGKSNDSAEPPASFTRPMGMASPFTNNLYTREEPDDLQELKPENNGPTMSVIPIRMDTWREASAVTENQTNQLLQHTPDSTSPEIVTDTTNGRLQLLSESLGSSGNSNGSASRDMNSGHSPPQEPSTWAVPPVNGSLSSEESGYQTEGRKKVFYEVVV